MELVIHGPDTAFAGGKEAMAEVVERHKAAGVDVLSPPPASSTWIAPAIIASQASGTFCDSTQYYFGSVGILKAGPSSEEGSQSTFLNAERKVHDEVKKNMHH